jgi:hypothetical protein
MDKYFKYDWDNRNQFINDLKQATSMSDFLKNQNLSCTSANFHTFKKKIKKHNINASELYQIKIRKKSTNKKSLKILDEEVFCINSAYDREFAKNRIVQKKLIPYICAKCHNNGFWMNEKLPLQLEHKNGNNFDNRLENLEYLCPNCHVQTTTYGSKNKHNHLFQKRIQLLKSYNEITDDIIEELVFKWKIKNLSVREWLLKHENKLKEENIVLNITRQRIFGNDKKIEQFFDNAKKENLSLNEISKKLNLSKDKLKQIIAVYSPELYNIFYSQKISIPSVNVDRHELKIAKEKKSQIIEVTSIIMKKSKKLNLITSRTQDAIALTNKKELPILAKKWGISVNATKKWIRNNLPEHFDTIFDDTLLVKNQKKQHKENYYQAIAQLKHDSFNLDEFMSQYNIKTKASAYALIKAHNPGLYEKLMPDVVCIYCTGKTRTAGQSGGKTRYRCLDCDKSFTRLLEIS